MHELSVATELLALATARLDPGASLGAVQIAVGELSSLDPALLRFAWEAVITGAPHAGCTLDIEWHAANQLCPDCGTIAERQPGSWLRLCPRCAAPLQIDGGDELDLLDVTSSLPTGPVR